MIKLDIGKLRIKVMDFKGEYTPGYFLYGHSTEIRGNRSSPRIIFPAMYLTAKALKERESVIGRQVKLKDLHPEFIKVHWDKPKEAMRALEDIETKIIIDSRLQGERIHRTAPVSELEKQRYNHHLTIAHLTYIPPKDLILAQDRKAQEIFERDLDKLAELIDSEIKGEIRLTYITN